MKKMGLNILSGEVQAYFYNVYLCLKSNLNMTLIENECYIETHWEDDELYCILTEENSCYCFTTTQWILNQLIESGVLEKLSDEEVMIKDIIE